MYKSAGQATALPLGGVEAAIVYLRALCFAGTDPERAVLLAKVNFDVHEQYALPHSR